MRFGAIHLLASGLEAAHAVVVAKAIPSKCPLDNCLLVKEVAPSVKPTASAFCEEYIHSKPGTVTVTVTRASTATATTTITPTTVLTDVVPAVATVTSGTVCQVTVTGAVQPFPTIIYYLSRPPTKVTAKKRDPALPIPTFLIDGCDIHNSAQLVRKVSSACSCFLTKSTTTVTATAVHTAVVTATGRVPVTQLATLTSVSTLVEQPCTATVTATEPGPYSPVTSCGISFTSQPTASTSDQVICSGIVPSPSAYVRLRIEGNALDGTIFEDCIASGPRNITTPSGGTHVCLGNGSAYPSPAALHGPNPIDMIDAAASVNGFTYDGTWSDASQDYTITRIAESPATPDSQWDFIDHVQLPQFNNSCQYVVGGLYDPLWWAMGVTNSSNTLFIEPNYAVALAGVGNVSTAVMHRLYGRPATGVPGASLGGQTSDANGRVYLPVPDNPGCYQYKATKDGYLISNALYVTVVESFQ